MASDLEVLQAQRIQELEAKLGAYEGSNAPKLSVLPNGDLHRGIRHSVSDPNVEVVPLEQSDPLNKAMSEILKAARGGKNLTCTYCGLQFDGMMSEKDVRAHLLKDHPSSVSKMEDAQVLMANLAEAQKELEVSKKK